VAQIKELLARLDADKSGSIRFEEFKNLVKAEGYPTIMAYTAFSKMPSTFRTSKLALLAAKDSFRLSSVLSPVVDQV